MGLKDWLQRNNIHYLLFPKPKALLPPFDNGIVSIYCTTKKCKLNIISPLTKKRIPYLLEMSDLIATYPNSVFFNYSCKEIGLWEIK